MSDAPTSMADRLYAPAPAPAAATAAPATPEAELAQRLYAAPPERVKDDQATAEVQRNRDADITRRFYSPQDSYALSLPDDALPGFDVPAVREVLADLHAEPADASEFAGLMKGLPQVSDEDRTNWRTESERLAIPAADLQRAQAYVAADKRLHELLHHTGLGNHPRVVARVVQLANAAMLRRPAKR